MFSEKGKKVKTLGSFTTIQLCSYTAEAATGNTARSVSAVFTKTRGGLDLAQE